MIDKEIKTVMQAKEFYRSMGCSSFHMAREFPQRYKEYCNLNITKQLEYEWKLERFNEYYDSIINNQTTEPLWSIHSKMYDLLEHNKTESELKKIFDITLNIQYKVSQIDRVIVSETINGRRNRQFRSGLIYLAYDMKLINIAKGFIELSLFFSIYEENKTRECMRCNSANQLCNEIRMELGL